MDAQARWRQFRCVRLGDSGSIAKLAAGQGRLPHGIEVQVLDLGYAEKYKKQHKKPADWFTSHGDVFPVGPVR